MSAFPYNMFNNNLPTFTDADLIAHMGLSDRTLYGPPPFTWATKAFLTRGKIAHGTSLPSGYASGLTTVDGASVPLGQNMYWDALAPWVVAIAESDNTCTNAYVKISQIQCFILSKRTGLWTRFGAKGRGYPSIAPGKYKYDYSQAFGPSTAIYDNDGAPCYWPWHTVGPEQVILHNPIVAKGFIDGEDFDGCFVTCQSQLVHPPGVAFDATPHYALSVGADLYPSMDATISNDILAGRSYLVAVGGSALKTIPSDGTPRMHYFITSPSVGVTAKDNTSIYELANGATSMYMSNAELAANMPVLTPNLNIVQKAAVPATAAIDISLAGGTTQLREGSSVLSIDFTAGTPTEIIITRNDNHTFAQWPTGNLSQYFTAVTGGLTFDLSMAHMNLDLNVVSVRAIYSDNQSTTDRLILTIQEPVLSYTDATFYAPLAISSTLTTGTGSPTFTRASTKNVPDHLGVYNQIATGIVAYGGVRPVQNLVIGDSEDFTNASWVPVGGVTVPTATSVTFTTGATDELSETITPSTGTALRTYTISCIMSGSIKVRFKIGQGGVANLFSSDVTLTGTPTRYEFTATTFGSSAGTGTVIFGLYRAVATNAGTITCSQIQLEDVSGQAVRTASEYQRVGTGYTGITYYTTAKDGSAIPAATQLGAHIDPTSKTNNLLWNRDLTNAAWVKTNCTPLKTQTGIGNVANACSLLTATSANATCLQTITAAATAASSGFHVKRSVGTGTISITRDNGSTWTDITSLINSSTFTCVKIENTSVTNPVVGFKISTSGDAIIVDAGMNHAGTQLTLPIFTTSAAVTRNADVFTYPTTSNFSDTACTIMATFKPTYDTWPSGSIVGKSGFGLLASSANSGVQAADGTNTASGQTGTPTGSVKLGCRWSGSSLEAFSATTYLSVGTAATYDGSFNLTTIGINTGVAGYIKDVAIYV